jgi:flagellar biosynthesis/type III secretory pathway protein FliH
MNDDQIKALVERLRLSGHARLNEAADAIEQLMAGREVAWSDGYHEGLEAGRERIEQLIAERDAARAEMLDLLQKVSSVIGAQRMGLPVQVAPPLAEKIAAAIRALKEPTP